jgi:hypothetical protein
VAALVAIRFNTAIREFYRRRRSAGTLKKVALAASMRMHHTHWELIVAQRSDNLC